MAVHGRSLRNGPGRTGASQASLGQCTTNGPQCQARRAKKPQRRGSRLLTPSAAAPRSGSGLDARSYNERPGGGPHAPCRDTRFTIFGLSTMPKKRRGAPPGPRPRLRSGAREARPMGDPPGAAGKGGEARPQASRSPEPPAGAAGRGGAGESPTARTAARKRHQQARAGAGAQQGPGGRSHQTAAEGRGPPGAGGSRPRSPRSGTGRGGPGGATRWGAAEAERSKGDRTGSPQPERMPEPEPDGASERPRSRAAAHKRPSDGAGGEPRGAGPASEARAPWAGPGPRSGAGRAAPEWPAQGQGPRRKRGRGVRKKGPADRRDRRAYR